jgi:hypothetical protein
MKACRAETSWGTTLSLTLKFELKWDQMSSQYRCSLASQYQLTEPASLEPSRVAASCYGSQSFFSLYVNTCCHPKSSCFFSGWPATAISHRLPLQCLIACSICCFWSLLCAKALWLLFLALQQQSLVDCHYSAYRLFDSLFWSLLVPYQPSIAATVAVVSSRFLLRPPSLLRRFPTPLALLAVGVFLLLGVQYVGSAANPRTNISVISLIWVIF